MILFDEQWELQTLLSKIKEKKEQLFNAYVKKLFGRITGMHN